MNENSKLLNSSRGTETKGGYLTGIKTYAYEVMKLPMKRSFMNSIRRNQQAKTESLKRMWDKANIGHSRYNRRHHIRHSK